MMPGCSKLARKVGVSLGFINFSCYTTWWQVVEAGEKERSETVHVSEHVWEAPWSGGAQALTVTTEGAQTFCWSALLSDIIFWESTGERVARILAGTAGFMFESLELAELRRFWWFKQKTTFGSVASTFWKFALFCFSRTVLILLEDRSN